MFECSEPQLRGEFCAQGVEFVQFLKAPNGLEENFDIFKLAKHYTTHHKTQHSIQRNIQHTTYNIQQQFNTNDRLTRMNFSDQIVYAAIPLHVVLCLYNFIDVTV